MACLVVIGLMDSSLKIRIVSTTKPVMDPPSLGSAALSEGLDPELSYLQTSHLCWPVARGTKSYPQRDGVGVGFSSSQPGAMSNSIR